MSDQKPVATTNETLVGQSAPSEIDAFVAKARASVPPGNGRLLLALDATMSRQPTWDLACELQGQMFDAVGKAGSLNVQLVYFRGFGECRSSKYAADTDTLKNLMSQIDCRAGHTQIGKVLNHALQEAGREKIAAMIYIGDAMEEHIDDLADKAGRLGLLGVPVFLFQEGRDADAERAFKEIARLTRGAWFRFDRNAASMLAKLLSSIAVFATGGLKALEARNRPEDRLMIEHMGRR